MPKGDERDGAPTDVELVERDAEVLGARDHLRGERFIDLDEVDVVDGHVGALECLTTGLDRAQTHYFGLRPLTPLETMRARGLIPSSLARVSLITTTAAAPSFKGQALPAVMEPPSRKTGCNVARRSKVVPARGPSSLVTTVPSGKVTG